MHKVTALAVKDMKTYRFFYHYNHSKRALTVHFKKKCYITKNIECYVKSNSKWNSAQPTLVMQGFCSELLISEDLICIK